MNQSASEPIKVRFLLERDEDGWPPVESEGVWATPCGADEFRLDNVPWFARGVAYGDLVRALADDTACSGWTASYGGQVATRSE